MCKLYKILQYVLISAYIVRTTMTRYMCWKYNVLFVLLYCKHFSFNILSYITSIDIIILIYKYKGKSVSRNILNSTNNLSIIYSYDNLTMQKHDSEIMSIEFYMIIRDEFICHYKTKMYSILYSKKSVNLRIKLLYI